VSRLLVHAVGSAEATTGRDRGLGGRALRWVRSGRLGAWATVWEGAPSALGRDELLAHHRLVEELSPCLPVRFGTWAADEAALAGLLRARERELLGALARVEGRRELAVTALWRRPLAAESAAEPHGGGPGRRFLERRGEAWRERARREALAGELAARLDETLELPPSAVQHRRCPSETVALSSAFLVAADRAAALGERLRAVGEVFPEVQLLVHGPWPPYSFVGNVEGEN
jgi:hypothetical protein